MQYDVFRRAEGLWKLVETLHSSGAGSVEYTETVPQGTTSTAYRVDVRQDGQVVAQLGPVELRFGEVPSISRIKLRAAPNPFNPRTTFEFTVPRQSRARLRIFDSAGRRVRVLVDEVVRGVVQRTWDGNSSSGRAVASGVYFAELWVDGTVESRLKVTLLR